MSVYCCVCAHAVSFKLAGYGKNSEWAQFQYFAYGRYNWAGELKRAGISTQNEMKSGEGTVSEKRYFTQ